METRKIKAMAAGFALAITFSLSTVMGQIQPVVNKSTIGVLSLESKGLTLDGDQLGNLVRIELEKTDGFRVVDKYDTREAIEKNAISTLNCFGRNCLVNVGKLLESEKMLTGSVERYGEKIIVSLRIIDVAMATIEKNQVNEFINYQNEVQAMLRITLLDLLGKQNDQLLVDKLTKIASFETSTTNPGNKKVNLSGPRMGVTGIFGKGAKRLSDNKDEGGYNVVPVFSQFGYQFETQYLNEGNFQALVEYLPMVTGIDQGLFIPSFTVMNGFRNSNSGWELAFGPTFSVTRKAKGYFNNDGKWILEKDYTNGIENKPQMIERVDKRGNPAINTGFIFAVGKTFKSGHLNIPVNAFFIPGRETWRVGISFGFNNKRV